jgi:hypothetical protein
MGDAIAVDGDVTATAGTTDVSGYKGSWTAGSVSCVPHPKMKINGTNIIYEASCTFSYTGANNSGSTTASETVTLSASKTTVSSNGNYVLLDGDSEEGTYGNKLEVNASNTTFKTS